MNTPINPPILAAPAANYSHAVLTDAATRWLHTSGVVPVRPDGTVPDDLATQAAVVWSNIGAMLAAADMFPTDIVSVATFLVASSVLASSVVASSGAASRAVASGHDVGAGRVDETDGSLADDLAVVMAARDGFMAGHRPASTLVTVPALAQPQWRVEVAVIAAR